MTDVFLYDAVRTPRGKARPDGALASLQPHELVRQCITAIDDRTGGGVASAESLLLGCVGQIGAQGANAAIVAKMHAGLDDAVSAWTINNFCVSGLSAVGQAAARIASGDEQASLAGGVEMMSRVPFMADRADYYADAAFPPRTRYVPVAVAADRLAATWDVGRDALDAMALASQSRAVEADAALGASRIAVTGGDGATLLDQDECVRPVSAEKLAAMEPAFGEIIGAYAGALAGETITPVHTVAHAPPMCDAAAIALVGGEGAVDAAPRARILAFAEAGGDPHASLTAGFAAMDKALAKAGLALGEMDRIEFMEAFGVTIARFLRDYDVDPARVNVGGGHLARGHPLGASGAILLSTLLDALDACEGRYGLVVTSGAQGVGAAMVVERMAR
ncbi:acetyl-CoA C-acetyltransferase/acetyl-CoA acyltransferase [Allosphingosinicella indica]|uniref:Acetyl-CoA C-acetyltransferase/acetyl-CoA acyltransferase n=1 Tax=Allosphingosinicella indica TaxID=941907 RepID=A0A1X7G039_9SPHN|nr:acetyl-CoA C-acetyltransferase/acetyl-CoA acyltransferase [Allosphingosinicella indica]